MKVPLPLLLLLVAAATGPQSLRSAEAVPPPQELVPPAAMEIIPDWEARLELARVLAYDRQYDASLLEFRRVLEAQPDRRDLQAEYGQVLAWAGHVDAAIATLTGLPRASLPHAALVLLADLLMGREEFAFAAELYRQALASAPTDSLTRFKLARVLSFQKNYDDSLTEYRTLLAALPDDVQIRRHYARTLGWADRVDESITEWRRTLPAKP